MEVHNYLCNLCRCQLEATYHKDSKAIQYEGTGLVMDRKNEQFLEKPHERCSTHICRKCQQAMILYGNGAALADGSLLRPTGLGSR